MTLETVTNFYIKEKQNFTFNRYFKFRSQNIFPLAGLSYSKTIHAMKMVITQFIKVTDMVSIIPTIKFGIK